MPFVLEAEAEPLPLALPLPAVERRPVGGWVLEGCVVGEKERKEGKGGKE